jgi:hypothetical protein
MLGVKRISLVDELRKAGVVYSRTEEWMTGAEVTRLMDTTRRRSRRGWHSLQAYARNGLKQEWQGLPIFRYAAPALKASCEDGAEFSAYFVETARRAIDRCKPDVLVCFEDWELPRAATLLCRQRKIPTIAYYSLSGASYPEMIRRSQEWMAVSGESLYRNFLPQYGGDHIRIVGDTVVDKAVSLSRDDARRKICLDFGLRTDAPIIVLLSTYTVTPMRQEDIKEMFQRTFDAASAVTGSQLVIKTHPMQPTERVKQWVADWGGAGTIIDNCDLFTLCRAADIVSTPPTSGVWQALVAGTPTVCLMPRETVAQFTNIGYGYLERKGIWHISTDQDARSVFRDLIFDVKIRDEQIRKGYEHAQEHVGPVDGHACERLVSFLKEVMHTALCPQEKGS